jgi:hypothetical protein
VAHLSPMATADDFRRLALALPGAAEGAHMGHADFRVGGRIFATLGYPDDGWGVVMLTRDEQDVRVEAAPEVFAPVKGGWGRQGSTQLRLDAADEATIAGALRTAWARRAPKRLLS